MATTFLSPGVYVQEVPSGSAPIAGVGTSTAGFIGVIDPGGGGPTATVRQVGSPTPIEIGTGTGTRKNFDLPAGDFPVDEDPATYSFLIDGVEAALDTEDPITNATETSTTTVKFAEAVPSGGIITASYQVQPTAPTSASSASVYTLPTAEGEDPFQSVPAGEVKLCTNFSEFKSFFGDFSTNQGQSLLAHAVYGFLRNGGTRCFVVWVQTEGEIREALEQFETIDEIAIVAAPGITSKTALTDLDTHCRQLQDRVAILDSPETITDLAVLEPGTGDMPGSSDYAAYYFPWIYAFDPATQAEKAVPPSGHMAGIYARVDSQRGVHKAPANEPVLGAVGLTYPLSKAKQAGLNPQGINCIRNLNGNIRVWGARTLGGDANGEFKYISVRRLFNFLRESIDEGTQWVVFEPNTPDLWAKISRNLTAFLTTVWSSGALFGNTPEEAFFVKCDAETNPPEVRDQGQVVTEIGVAVTKPAEFVIFRLSQWAGPGRN